MMSVHGVRSRQPVVGDTIGWWWDAYEASMDESSILEMYRFQNMKKTYQYMLFDKINKRRKLLWTLLYIAAEEA